MSNLQFHGANLQLHGVDLTLGAADGLIISLASLDLALTGRAAGLAVQQKIAASVGQIALTGLAVWLRPPPNIDGLRHLSGRDGAIIAGRASGARVAADGTATIIGRASSRARIAGTPPAAHIKGSP